MFINVVLIAIAWRNGRIQKLSKLKAKVVAVVEMRKRPLANDYPVGSSNRRNR